MSYFGLHICWKPLARGREALTHVMPAHCLTVCHTGIGVMKSVRQKRLAKAVLKNATSNNTGGRPL
eukprot:1137802-Pelagomonas_calceolata.AAC.2